MENQPVISLSFGNAAPGANEELHKRYRQWTREVYLPLQFKNPAVIGLDSYEMIEESRLFPSYGSIFHFENMEDREKLGNSQENRAIADDLIIWARRGVQEIVWRAVYQLVRAFGNAEKFQRKNTDTRIDNAPIMHLEGYRLSPDEREMYNTWLETYGYDFISLFLKLPGIKGYDFFKDTGLKYPRATREGEYPSNLSILYFENMQSFEDYTKCKELIVFEKALRNVFPNGLNLKWYVQYQLVKSWRK